MGEQRRRWSADHRWQHPGGFCTRAGAAAVRDSGARSMEDARAACFGQLAVPLFWPTCDQNDREGATWSQILLGRPP